MEDKVFLILKLSGILLLLFLKLLLFDEVFLILFILEDIDVIVLLGCDGEVIEDILVDVTLDVRNDICLFSIVIDYSDGFFLLVVVVN